MSESDYSEYKQLIVILTKSTNGNKFSVRLNQKCKIPWDVI